MNELTTSSIINCLSLYHATEKSSQKFYNDSLEYTFFYATVTIESSTGSIYLILLSTSNMSVNLLSSLFNITGWR